MFERGRKDDETHEISGETARVLPGALRPAGAETSGHVAVIGQSIQINGDVRGNEDLRIEGDVSGTIELRNSHLTIGKQGKVKADVYAKSIAVDGVIEGDLYATEKVVIHVNAKVKGNIIAPVVGLDEGASFKGSIEMDRSVVEKALGKSAARADEPRSSGAADAGAPPKKAADATRSALKPPAGAA